MNSFTRDLVQYSGIDSYIYDECYIGNTSNFKQSNIDLELCLPKQKPDIEQIVKVDVSTDIFKTRLIKTPKGKSFEGQIMTGYKLLILGQVKLKIRYVADEPEQSMHCFYAYIPFCDYIVMPKTTCNINPLVPEVYVEDIYIDKMNCRCLFSNLNIFLVVETS